jgi:hypothetical protein
VPWVIGNSRRAVRLVVRCPCGTSTAVQAGASVACECGRSWDTGHLPTEDLDGVDRLVRRARSRRLLFVLNLLLVTALLVLVGQSWPVPAVLLTAFVWWRFCRPEWRRRRHSPQTAALPTWQLPASGGALSTSTDDR